MPTCTLNSYARYALAATAVALGTANPVLALTAGENKASASVEAFSSYRTSVSTAEVQDYQEGQDGPLEGSGPIAAGTTRLSQALGASGPISNAAASGWARAGAAGVTAATSATGVANGNTTLLNGSFARAESSAGWWDTVLVTSQSASNGRAGRLTAYLVVTGDVTASVGPSFSQAYAAFSVAGTSVTPVGGFDVSTGCQFSAGYCTYTSAGGYNGWADGTRSFGSRTIALDVPFVYGTPFEIGFSVFAKAFAQGISFTDVQTFTQADGVSAFGHTVVWGGIDGIFLGGTQIESYVIESGSGTDFRFADGSVTTPVPEASSAAMLLAGLALLAGLVQRRVR
jgi:hypothetical protein